MARLTIVHIVVGHAVWVVDAHERAPAPGGAQGSSAAESNCANLEQSRASGVWPMVPGSMQYAHTFLSPFTKDYRGLDSLTSALPFFTFCECFSALTLLFGGDPLPTKNDKSLKYVINHFYFHI